MTAVLGAEEILNHLRAGRLITNWDEAEHAGSVRGASFDVHIASDQMTVPNPSGGEPFHYAEGDYRSRAVVLSPGETASVTSRELFCLPWDIAGNIGVRFGFARQGILVHTGLLIHPGYGNMADRNGNWDRTPQRLHFLIANISTKQVSFDPGDTRIASIQFLTTSSTPDRRNPGGVGSANIEDVLDSGQLGLFTEYQALRRAVDKHEDSFSNIILFGIYVLAAAFLGVVLTFGIQLLGSEAKTDALRNGLDRLSLSMPEAIVLTAAIIGSVVVIALVLRALGGLLAVAVGGADYSRERWRSWRQKQRRNSARKKQAKKSRGQET